MQGSSQQILTLLNLRKEELSKENQEYLQAHPEVTELLNDFSLNLFMQKPENVLSFMTTYFSALKMTPKLFKPIVISGPSGVGKGTLIELLFKEFPGVFSRSVSYTTRLPRPGEVNGREYYFVTEEVFLEMVKEEKFLEHCNVHGKMYGTSKAEVERIAANHQICILEIDVQGALKVYKVEPDINFLFVYPPTSEALKERIKGRGTETEAAIKVRLENAMKELDFANKSTLYKYRVVNDNLVDAFEELKGLLCKIYAEEFKIIQSVLGKTQ